MAQRVGVPCELVVELAVEEFLEDPDLEELTRPYRHELKYCPQLKG